MPVFLRRFAVLSAHSVTSILYNDQAITIVSINIYRFCIRREPVSRSYRFFSCIDAVEGLLAMCVKLSFTVENKKVMIMHWRLSMFCNV